MKLKIFILFFFTVLTLHSQKHDYIWIMGYGGENNHPNNNDFFGNTILDFNKDSLNIYEEYDISLDFRQMNTSCSDKNGYLLFYSNGEDIQNHIFEPMQNGEDINLSELSSFRSISQAMLTLPFPNKENKYLVFHAEQGWIDIPGWTIEAVGLYYSILDMNLNNGLGAVTLKREPLIVDTLQYGKLTAIKHANGRDWWMVVNESHSNRFYTILISPNGVEIVDHQIVGVSPNIEGSGQAVFSPDGQYYVTFNAIDDNIGKFLQVYDFDRCTGQLGNQRLLNYNDGGAGGIAISANSRYLYVPSHNYLYQFDLWAEDIFVTQDTVAIYDGFQSPFGSKFYRAQLAPNGKIYINSPNSENVLHVIHNPDEAGDACNVEQHGVQLPTYNAFTMPNFPNYRLGKLKGSPCDTIVSSTGRPISKIKEVKVYPNPASYAIDIQFSKDILSSDVFFEMRSIEGARILQKELAPTITNHQIDLQDIPNGIYIYSIWDKNKLLKTDKLVIIK